MGYQAANGTTLVHALQIFPIYLNYHIAVVGVEWPSTSLTHLVRVILPESATYRLHVATVTNCNYYSTTDRICLPVFHRLSIHTFIRYADTAHEINYVQHTKNH